MKMVMRMGMGMEMKMKMRMEMGLDRMEVIRRRDESRNKREKQENISSQGLDTIQVQQQEDFARGSSTTKQIIVKTSTSRLTRSFVSTIIPLGLQDQSQPRIFPYDLVEIGMIDVKRALLGRREVDTGWEEDGVPGEL